jgi:hypothetical protein
VADDFKLAGAYVELGLKDNTPADEEKVKERIKGSPPVEMPVKAADPITAAWKSKLDGELRDLAFDSLNIPTSPETEKFRIELNDVLSEIHSTVHGDIPLKPADLADFHTKVDAAVKAAAADIDVRIPVEANTQPAEQAVAEGGLQMGPLLAAGISVGAPVVAGAMTGAVVAGLIGIGAALHKGDAAIDSGWNALVGQAKTEATQASQVMVAPISGALDKIRTMLGNEQPAFARLFSGAAGDIPILTDGLDSLVEDALPGLTNMVENSEPIVHGLATVMGDVGAAVSDISNDISSHADTIGQDLGGLGNVIHDLGDSAGSLITIGSDLTSEGLNPIEDFAKGSSLILGLLAKGADGFKSSMDLWINPAPKTDNTAKAITNVATATNAVAKAAPPASANVSALKIDVGKLGDESATTKDKISALQDAIKLMSETGLEKANDEISAFYDGLDQLGGQLKNATGRVTDANGALNLTTQKGRAVQSAVESARDAMVGYAQSASDAGVPSEQINGHLQTMYTSLEHDLLPAFGGNKKAVDAMLLSMGLVPKQITTDVSAPGAVTSTDQIASLMQQVGRIPVGKSITVTSLTSTAMAMLQSLGLKVTTLPNGQVKITASTAQAAKDVQNFINAESGRTIFIPIKGVASPSTGKAILGPYHQAIGHIVAPMADGAYLDSSIGQVVPPGVPKLVGDATVPELFAPLNGSDRTRELISAAAAHENVSTGGSTWAPTINNYISVQDNDSAEAVAAKTSAQTQWDLMTMRTG